jgi:hypothetical protein
MVIGLLLFALYNTTGNTEIRQSHITLTNEETSRLVNTWQRRWSRQASTEDIEMIIDTRIREEVLYREALMLEMDQNDPVVRRRLSQKMAFMFEDTSIVPEPSEQELHAFLVAEQDKFIQPAHYSLRHIFFSRDQRGRKAKQEARAHLQRLKTESENSALHVADRFMHEAIFRNASSTSIARQLGDRFVKELDKLTRGNWQGPITSAYGAHLVYIDSKQAAQLPSLTEVREQVLVQWQTQQRQRLNAAAYQALRQRYSVTVDWPKKQEASSP